MTQELFGQPGTAKLGRLAAALRAVHKSLIESVRREYERAHGPVTSPYALLSLVANEPAFAWLGPMTRLIVELEDALGPRAGPVGKDDLARARRRVEDLLGAAGTDFAIRYQARVLDDPAVAAEHGCLRALLRD
jgi:hypothetical protein